MITLGSAGALLRCAAGAWLASPPPVTAINDVGNGDAFLAALALAYDRGRPPAEALRLAVAAGAANACSASVAGWTGNTLHQLAAATRVEAMSCPWIIALNAKLPAASVPRLKPGLRKQSHLNVAGDL